MTNQKLQRIKKIAAFSFMVGLIHTIISFFIVLELDFGRANALEFRGFSVYGSLVCSFTIYHKTTPATHWFYRIKSTSIHNINKPSTTLRSSSLPTSEAHDEEHDYGVLQTYTHYRGGVIRFSTYTIYLPILFILIAVAFGAIWFLTTNTLCRRRMRAAASCCIKCGYDLRATPVRCPECGALIEYGKVPIIWREPLWYFTMRRNSVAFKKMIRWNVFGVITLLVAIGGLICLPFFVPLNDDMRGKFLFLLIISPPLTVFIALGIKQACYPPTIEINERGVLLGSDPMFESNAIKHGLLNWKHIQGFEIILTLKIEPCSN